MLNRIHQGTVVMFALLLSISNVSAEPNTNELKYWLGTQKVVTKKRGKLLPSKSELLANGDIQKLKVTGKKNGLNKIYSITTLTLDFDFLPPNAEVPIACTGTVTYSWTTAAGPLGKNELENVIAKCL